MKILFIIQLACHLTSKILARIPVKMLLNPIFLDKCRNFPDYRNPSYRAKTQLKSQLLMNLEVRPVMFEDMARQVRVLFSFF